MVHTEPETLEVESRLPTKFEGAVFRLKTALFQVKHHLTGNRGARFTKSAVPDVEIVAESRSALRSTDRVEEIELESGKVQNLRVAAGYIDRIAVPKGGVFSFWAHVPRPTRGSGFVEGRELREGCIVPSIGGGLCQLSNALYDSALKAGLEIVERHGHSRKVPGSFAEAGRDATIFWNYVDLKFRADCDWQIRAFLTGSELVVQILASESPGASTGVDESVPDSRASVQSCETCGMTSCFRHPEKMPRSLREFSTWAVDSYYPELGDFMAENCSDDDWLMTPLSSRRKYGASRYQWPADPFAKVVDFPGFVLRRGLVSRRLANQGAERQAANLRFNQNLAEKMIRRVPHRSNHLVVSLELLPYFWRAGVLGGRKFDVLMTRWPLYLLQEKLDVAAARWPESPTLADFRVDGDLCDLEREALDAADSWITSHPEIAKVAGEGKVQRLDWKVPDRPPLESGGGELILPATTAGRNGVWELREAIRQLDIPLRTMGANVESPTFWDGLDVTSIDPSAWQRQADAVVLPAWISNRPTRLLQAVACGIPVITTNETGISDLPGVTIVDCGDPDSLAAALSQVISVNQQS